LAVTFLNWRHEQQRCVARAVMEWPTVDRHIVVVNNESTEGMRSVCRPPRLMSIMERFSLRHAAAAIAAT
jgi:hypothetical protein